MEEYVKKYLKAGRIASRVREEALRIVKPGVKIIDVCEKLEGMIKELGGKPAFPVNVSINEIAAHYTSPIGDESVIPYPSLVKVDIGVHIDGYIADTATTVVLSDDVRLHDLAQASQEALEKALKIVGVNVRIKDVGEVIERTIKSFGFKPIKNLTGHSLDQYNLHSGVSIPNYGGLLIFGRFEHGRAYAIEPFATMGSGYVVDTKLETIFSILREDKVRGGIEKNIIEYVDKNHNGLPFAERWLKSLGDVKEIRKAIKFLVKRGILRSYPVLTDSDNALVSQAEHTVLVLEGETIITTL